MTEDDFPQRTDNSLGVMLIHGVGLIGGSLGLAAKRAGLVREVFGVGRDLNRLARATHKGAIDRSFLDQGGGLEKAVAKADIIFLCTPVPNITADLPAVLKAAKPTAVITDVGSVKAPIIEAAGGDDRFIGSHPMAGSEQAGVDAADADLFHGATWALTPSKGAETRAYKVVKHFAEALGAITRTLDPKSHDEAVAVTSHLPHILAYALMAQAADAAKTNKDLPYLSAGSFASGTRVAGSLPSLWQGISLENKEALSAALRAYRQRLDRVQEALDSADADAILAQFTAGHEARLNWPGK